MRDVLIIGGGISGLVVAFRLHQMAAERGLPLRYGLIESAPHFGGKVVTERRDGFVIEGGPDAFVVHKPWALELVRELGLAERLLPSNDEHRRSFIFSDQRLIELPPGFQYLVPGRIRPFLRSPLLSWTAKMRILRERFISPREDRADESVADFVRRRLGDEALERLAEPLLAHIHVGDIERMSLRATYPQLAALERQGGSLSHGMRARRKAIEPGRSGPLFWTLRDGMAELVETLAARLDPEARLLGRRVVGLGRQTFGSDIGYRVQLRDGTHLDARAVVLATPANIGAPLVRDLDTGLSDRLAAIRYVSVATLSLAYRRSDIEHALNGFGFFVPRHEQRRILACTWTSTKFDRRSGPDHVLLRVFLGGADHEALLERDDEELLRIVRDELRTILGLRTRPVLSRLYRWPQGYPQYDVGHLERVQTLGESLPSRFFLAGSAFDGVGLPDCIRSSTNTARRVFESLEHKTV